MRWITKLGLAGLLSINYAMCTPQKVYSEDKKPEIKAQENIDDLTQAEVDKLMLRKNVDEILKEEYESGRIQRVNYDSSTGRTNFREIVYQEHLPANERKPVLMLVADADGEGWFEKEKYVADKGNAIILKSLTKKHTQFRVVTYDPMIDPEFRETAENEIKFGAELEGENVSVRPSILVYGAKRGNDFERLYRLSGGPHEHPIDADILKYESKVCEKIESYGL